MLVKTARKYQDLGVTGAKAREYDSFSRDYRAGDFAEYASVVADLLNEGARVLDVATGPGYFCTELAARGDFAITGIDISADLIEIASANARSAGVDVEFVSGNASALPFPDASFDLVFCSWAVKNFRDPERALNEMHRVLAPGGTALIVDLDHDARGPQWTQYAADRGLTGSRALMMRLAFTIQRTGAYTRAQFEDLIRTAPFRDCSIRSRGINLEITMRA